MERPPAAAAAVLAAAFPAIVVLSFDQLEHMLGRALGHDGGPVPLLLAVALFFVAWTPGVAILQRCAAPAAGGLLAGLYVAAVMAAVLAPLWAPVGPFIVFVWMLFAALAMASGAAAGGIAAVLDGAGGGAGPIVVVLALLLAVLLVPFTPVGPLALAVLAVPVALALVGSMLWWRAAARLT